MKKLSKIAILITALFLSANTTLSYYNTNNSFVSIFKSNDYVIGLNGMGGNFSESVINIKNNNTKLPTPIRRGYSFLGFSESMNGNVVYLNNISNVIDINNKTLYAKWQTNNYSITYNLNGGTITTPPTTYNVEQTFTLPTPSKTGYKFTGWTGTDLYSETKEVVVSNSVGNKIYTANWTKNYYTVNYFVNNSLWQQRFVGYNDGLENLNAQSALDNYHTFHGWNNWVNNMPNYDINLYASITESYCQLTTGHGPYANASGLLKVFQSAGWTGTIMEAASAPGNFLVVTDYTLTRAQAEAQKNYIASHTNYNNYKYPYLYWVAVTCTNGYAEAWTRSLGQSNFN